MSFYDVIVVGGGPAGASCAAVCARAGLRVLVLERATFPRDKVCGDCLNPDCWPVLARLGVEEAVRRLPHTRLEAVEFVSARGRRVSLPLPETGPGEIAVKRSALDDLLLRHAARLGATVRQGAAVCAVRRADNDGEAAPAGSPRFLLETAPSPEGPPSHADAAPPPAGAATFTARFLVAADGRNSLVARRLGLLPDRVEDAAGRPLLPNRVGLQTHAACPAKFGSRVRMQWFAGGYGGVAPVGGGELNLSLTGAPRALPALKRWAQEEFGLPADTGWRTIAPLDRAPAPLAAREDGVFLTGDAARVVEPFTGEGIFYALRSGELAAEAIVGAARAGEPAAAGAARAYRLSHRRMYAGRLWVNRLARAAGLHPRAAGWALEAARWYPGLLGLLTRKVVRG